MNKYKRHNFCVFSMLVNCLLIITLSIEAHYIKIDHDVFRVNGFPRPNVLPNIQDVPFYLHAKEVAAEELMTDLTNELSFKILHYHSILNRNNFAFSPSALMSILIALYEGSAGQSAAELNSVLEFPTNRDLIRVGYRDIHRKLRTYFFEADNPLKGLSLNKENVTVTPAFESLLMFYGYDLGMDMVSSIIDLATANMSVTQNKTDGITEKNISTEIEMTVNPLMATSTQISVEETTKSLMETTTGTFETTSIDPTNTELTNIDTVTTISDVDNKSNDPNQEGEVEELISAFVADSEPLLRIENVNVTTSSMGKLKMLNQSNTLTSTYLPAGKYIDHLNKRKSRQKRHFVDNRTYRKNLFETILHTHEAHSMLFPITGQENVFSHITDGMERDHSYNADIINHIFYLTEHQTVYTTYKVYNAVLFYKYIDATKMSVLELELDTSNYNLMIFLPDYNTDLVTAASSLRIGTRLRFIRKQLKPRWVQATIPDFKLHGSIFLTNDLQNMGIRDIFEPNRANFESMTDQSGIYVKHIEQSINVHIRTNPIKQTKRNYNAVAKPIQISVNHPFLFFIVDRELDIALMAGRILNPLNVRIL